MTPERTTAFLWAAFAAASSITFALGGRDEALDFERAYITVGLINTVLAGVLLWRHGISLATPVILAVYVIANKWWFLLVFLYVIFWHKAAP